MPLSKEDIERIQNESKTMYDLLGWRNNDTKAWTDKDVQFRRREAYKKGATHEAEYQQSRVAGIVEAVVEILKIDEECGGLMDEIPQWELYIKSGRLEEALLKASEALKQFNQT